MRTFNINDIYIDELLNVDYAEQFLDLAALGIK